MQIPTANVKSSQYDVLIVGAGPSGLMIGQALGRLGIRVRIIERRFLGAQYGNADGLQPRTLEIWKSYGILDEIVSKGTCMRALVGYETSLDGRDLLRSRPSNNIVAPSRYPYEVTASITDIEGTLRLTAEEAGVEITQPSWPISFDISEADHFLGFLTTTYPINVTIEHSEQLNVWDTQKKASLRTEVINAKFLIGADGANSWIRKTLGIEMEGEQTEDIWGVIDVLMDTDFSDYRFKCVIQATSGAIIIIPREGEKVRVYVQMSARDSIPRSSDGRIDRSVLAEEEIRRKIMSRVKEGLRPYTIEFTNIFWSTIFSTSQKVAAKFSSKERVFIVGDACHTHSPKAGQGANASMGDAHNLAWKLAYVLRGWASPSLLQTYEVERRAYAMDLISFDREISMSLEGRAASDYQRLLHKRNLFSSGMGINYATSKLTIATSDSDTLVLPGDRLPSCTITRLADWNVLDVHDLLISDGLFKLLVLPGDISLQESKSNLQEVASEISNSIKNQHSPEIWDMNSNASSRVAIYTIVKNYKEDITWKDIPSCIVESWRCCFSTEGEKQDLYEKFKISTTTHSDGVLILIRPDGYVSLISRLKREYARQAVDFVYRL